MLKIVIDTNLLIDAASDDFNFGNRIIDEILEGKLEAFANRQTLAENKMMSFRKVSDRNYFSKLSEFFEKVNLVDNKKQIQIVEDADDNKILESAVEADAEYLITSDNHLLKVGQYDNVKIVTPRQFWSIYEEENGLSWQNWLSNFIK